MSKYVVNATMWILGLAGSACASIIMFQLHSCLKILYVSIVQHDLTILASDIIIFSIWKVCVRYFVCYWQGIKQNPRGHNTDINEITQSRQNFKKKSQNMSWRYRSWTASGHQQPIHRTMRLNGFRMRLHKQLLRYNPVFGDKFLDT